MLTYTIMTNLEQNEWNIIGSFMTAPQSQVGIHGLHSLDW